MQPQVQPIVIESARVCFEYSPYWHSPSRLQRQHVCDACELIDANPCDVIESAYNRLGPIPKKPAPETGK